MRIIPRHAVLLQAQQASIDNCQDGFGADLRRVLASHISVLPSSDAIPFQVSRYLRHTDIGPTQDRPHYHSLQISFTKYYETNGIPAGN